MSSSALSGLRESFSEAFNSLFMASKHNRINFSSDTRHRRERWHFSLLYHKTSMECWMKFFILEFEKQQFENQRELVLVVFRTSSWHFFLWCIASIIHSRQSVNIAARAGIKTLCRERGNCVIKNLSPSMKIYNLERGVRCFMRFRESELQFSCSTSGHGPSDLNSEHDFNSL